MNIYGWNKKYAIVLSCIMLVCLTVLGGLIAYKILIKDQAKTSHKKDATEDLIEIEKDDSLSIEVINDSIVTGAQVIAKYSEVKEDECAILIATNAFLEENKEELIDSKEYPHMRYILSKQNQGVVENVYSINGQLVSLAYINYNLVLGDSCLYQSYSQTSYEVPLGFSQEKNKKEYFPLTQSKTQNIYTIHEDAEFLTKTIYDDEGKIVGYAYLEQ